MRKQLFYNVWVVVPGNFGKQCLTAAKTIGMTNTDIEWPKMEISWSKGCQILKRTKTNKQKQHLKSELDNYTGYFFIL